MPFPSSNGVRLYHQLERSQSLTTPMSCGILPKPLRSLSKTGLSAGSRIASVRRISSVLPKRTSDQPMVSLSSPWAIPFTFLWRTDLAGSEDLTAIPEA